MYKIHFRQLTKKLSIIIENNIVLSHKSKLVIILNQKVFVESLNDATEGFDLISCGRLFHILQQ